MVQSFVVLSLLLTIDLVARALCNFFFTTSATPPLKMPSLIVCPLLHLFLPDAPLKMYCLSLYILYFTTFFYRKMTFHNSWKHSKKLGSPSLQGVRQLRDESSPFNSCQQNMITNNNTEAPIKGGRATKEKQSGVHFNYFGLVRNLDLHILV